MSKLDAAIDVYLTSRHREHPEAGCTIATLGSELARDSGKARAQIDANARAWLATFAECAPGLTQASRTREATGAFAAMIGGLILARAVEDPHEADRILADVRAFLHGALG